MRIASCLIGFTLLLPVVSAAPAAAQQSPTMPACSGTYNIVRVSDIKPGMMETFLQAVAAQKAWYQKAGSTDGISVMRIVDGSKYSETEALTSHTQAVGAQRANPDEDFGKFVELFKKSSTIKNQYITCQEK